MKQLKMFELPKLRKVKIYIAGKLFKKQDQKERKTEETHLLKILKGVKIFNPITQPFNTDKDSKKPTAKTIFESDTRAIIKSDIIIAELDEDEGVAAELGIAYGINYMRQRLTQIKEKADASANPFDCEKAIANLLEEIPHKVVYSHNTDLRIPSTGDYDSIYVPYGYNQYVIGMCDELGEVFVDKTKMYQKIKEVTEECQNA